MASYKQRKRSKEYTENVKEQIKKHHLDHFFHCYFRNRLGVELIDSFLDSDIYYSKLNELIGIPEDVYNSQFSKLFNIKYTFNFYDIKGFNFPAVDFFKGIDRKYLTFIDETKQDIENVTNQIAYELLEEDEYFLSFQAFKKEQQLTPFVYTSNWYGKSDLPARLNYSYQDIIRDFELFKKSSRSSKIEQINNYKLLMIDEYNELISKIESMNFEVLKQVILEQFIIDSIVQQLFQKIKCINSKYLLIQDWLYQFYFNMCVIFTATMNMENNYLFFDINRKYRIFDVEVVLYCNKNPYIKSKSFIKASYRNNKKSKSPLLQSAKFLIQKINCYESFQKEIIQCVDEKKMNEFIFKHTLPDCQKIADDFCSHPDNKNTPIHYLVIAHVMEHAKSAMIEHNVIDLYWKRSKVISNAQAELESEKFPRKGLIKKMPVENTYRNWIEEYEKAVKDDPLVTEFLKNQEN